MFIAIESPPEVKEALRRAQEALRRSLHESAVRWTSEQQFHLTLRFFGNVDTTSLAWLSDSLTEACRDFRALRLQARGIGFFPSVRKPRVIWAGMSDQASRLRELHRLIADTTASFGNEKPENDFHGHITLGRIKQLSRGEAAGLIKAAERFDQTVFGQWKVESVQLIRSQLSLVGPAYSTVAEPRLA
jgi:2'-5' RNA ligase